MQKATVKGASGIFLCWIGLMAVVCVPSFIAGVAYTKPATPITLLNATVTGPDSGILPLSNAANLNAEPDRPGQPARRQTAKVLERGNAINGQVLCFTPDK